MLCDFKYFLEVYRVAFFFKKMHFQKSKSEYLHFRRDFLKKGEMHKYQELVRECNIQDVKHLQEVLDVMYIELGITEKIFRDSVVHYQRLPD